MSDPAPFVHLHCHTDYSLLDGCAKINRYVQRCKELNMPALAMTDHGNLFGAFTFYSALKKAGIKPLVGCEIYLVQDHKQSEKPKRDRKRSDDIDDIPDQALGPQDFPKHQIHHKTLIARNFEGYQNLVKLVSDAHEHGMYYRPRTDMELLAKYSKGVTALSGCINGVASQYLLYNDYENARRVTGQFIDIFGKEHYFIELQNHGMPAQKRIIPGLVKLAKEFELPIVAANDVHYVYREDALAHDALLCIQTGKILEDEDRLKYPNHEFYLKSRAEMESAFSELPEAIENTLRVAEQVDLKIPTAESHYPVYERPIEISYTPDPDAFDKILDIYVTEKNKVLEREKEPLICLSDTEREAFRKNGLFLLDLCKEGLKERYGVDFDHPEAYVPKAGESADAAQNLCQQLAYEIAIITGTGFVDYFLIVWDFIHWARTHGIPVGPGRGSGAGCMVAYILKITDIEPLRFGLLFERMLNLERVSPPDFDVDFCMRRRDDVVNYVREKYGDDRVANIITYGTFGAKMVVRDLARVMNMPYAEANRVAKMIPNDLNITLEESVEKSAELRAEVQRNPMVREIVHQGKVIEGMVRNTGKHACGIIIGDQPLTNLVPMTLQEGNRTTQFAKGPVEDLGMLKCDFLGLKTLTVISDAQDHIRRTTDLKDFDIEKIPLDDAKTFALLNEGQTTGVFQLESSGMQALCRQIELSKFEEIIALIALYRPGPMQFIPQFIEGKKDPSKIQVPHPLLKTLVSETYGVLVYQEQVMQAARIIAGYTLGNADILRRAMGKKKPEIMAQQRANFVEGARVTNGFTERVSGEIFGILEKFAQYGFNKSHSAAYAMLSYRTAYMKANYPIQFMAGVLGCELGNADKVAHFIEECSAMGIPVLGPDVNASRETFTPVIDAEGSSIRFGLAAIKGVGDAAAAALIAERDQNGKYKDFLDFVTRVDGKSINRRVLENLIKTGGFDRFGDDRLHLLEDLDKVLKDISERQKDRERGQANLFDFFDVPPPKKSASKTKRPEMSVSEKLSHEKDLLGFYVSGHPLNAFKGLAEALCTFQGEHYKNQPDKTPFRICGVINAAEKKLSRRDNRPWALVSLSTRTHNYTLNLYSEAFEKINAPYQERMVKFKAQQDKQPDTVLTPPQDPLGPGSLVVIEGTIQQRNGEAVLNMARMSPLGPAIAELIKKVTFVLKPEDSAADFMKQLRETLEPEFGRTPVSVAFNVASERLIVADIASSLTWKLNPESFSRLKAHPAFKDVVIDVPPPEKEVPRWGPRN
jgi:DNA polymerase-3 subunit alpha